MRCLSLLACAALNAQPLDIKSVARLKVAWTYRTGASTASANNRKAAFDHAGPGRGTLYVTTRSIT